MRALLSLVERDVARFGPLVRARWDDFEGGLALEAGGIETGRTPSGTVLTDFMRRAVGSSWPRPMRSSGRSVPLRDLPDERRVHVPSPPPPLAA
jgi:hypothetical protein